MKMKKVAMNGRYFTAQDGVVFRMGGSCSGGPMRELTFAEMDSILERMELRAKAAPGERVPEWTAPVAHSANYPAEVLDNGESTMLVFGCWTVGGLERFKAFYGELKKINESPAWVAPEGVIEVHPDTGYFIKAHEGYVYTCDEDGNLGGNVMSLVDLNNALANMEYRKTFAAPEAPKQVTITGTGDKVQLTYACQVFTLARVKEIQEALNKAGATTKTEPVAG